jgi:[ribosomal protein S18]-alanine N-acetyltransferase
VIEPTQPLIAPMTESDLDDVCALAEASFMVPWTRWIFEEELGRPFAVLRVLRSCPGGPLVAFVSTWIVRDELHVLNLATHPAVRRRGYGWLLMHEVLALAQAQGVRYVTLEVRRSNAAAIKLYRKLDFESIGIRPRYYADTVSEQGEDAIVMMKTLEAGR